MRRSLIFFSVAHIVLGLISLGTGIAWLVLNYTNDVFKDDRLPQFVYLVMFPEIICGLMIFVSGCIGLGVKQKSSCAGLFCITCNIFNAFVWSPVLAVGYTFLVLTMYGLASCGTSSCLPTGWETYNLQYLLPEGQDWGYILPGIGMSVALIDFLISFGVIFTYCCSRTKKQMEVTENEG